jgi:ACS family sodium-dependent inorganic phosphate cotransporter
LGKTVSTEKRFLPLGKVFTSIPFIALLILHYGSLWGLFFLMNAAPMFMVQALNFNLSKAGFVAALPPLARLIAGFIFGSIGDLIRSKKIFSVTTVRKSFCLFCKFTNMILLT